MENIPISALQRLRIEPIIAYHSEPPAGRLDMEVVNPFYTFWFVERGHIRMRWAEEVRDLCPGDAIFLPPGFRRHHRIAEGTRMLSISFWAGWDNGRLLVYFGQPLSAQRAEVGDMIKAASRFCRRARTITSPWTPLGEQIHTVPEWLVLRGAFDAFVNATLSWLAGRGIREGQAGEGDLRLGQVLTELRSNPRAGALPYARWQEQTGLSRAQLDRLARRWLGTTLRQRRDELLFLEIQRALSKGRESLKELAARLDFCDAAHFSRWIKCRAGKNPRDLRGGWV